jgi:hypothetical protein
MAVLGVYLPAVGEWEERKRRENCPAKLARAFVARIDGENNVGFVRSLGRRGGTQAAHKGQKRQDFPRKTEGLGSQG